MPHPQLPEWENLAAPARPPVPYPDEPMDWAALHARPRIDPTAWVAPGAVVFGRVILKARSSVWFGCVVRGDEEYIEIGEETNLQDGAILHVDRKMPCVLGDRVSVAHGAIVHGSVVHHGALIGIHATVLSGCVIGAGALIAGGSLVKEGTQVPPGTLWAGCPAKQLRELNEDQRERVRATYRNYVNYGALYLARYGRTRIGETGIASYA
jgi:carbonic anhydrase/acetyltransferase-like protein (isoleucine patch superfamily)